MRKKQSIYTNNTLPLFSTRCGWVWPVLITCSPLLILKNTSDLTFQEIGVFLALALILFIYFLKHLIRQKPLHLKPLDLPIIFLILYFTFDFCKVLVLNMSITEWFHWRKFVLVLVYFPISTEFCSKKRIDRLFILLISTGCLISILQLNEILSVATISDLYVPISIVNTYPWWTLLLLVGIARFVFLKQVKIKRIIKLLFLVALIICLIKCLAGAARTPLLTVSICILLSIWFNIKEQRRINIRFIASFLLFFSLLGYFSELIPQYIHRLHASQIEIGLSSRSEQYSVAWERFLESPFIGNTEDRPFYYYNIFKKTYEVGSTHSLYFYILVKGGVLGCIIFIFFIYRVLSLFITVLKMDLPPGLRMYAEASFVTVLSMFVTGLTSTAMFHVESWLFLGVLLGILNCIYCLNLAQR